MTDKQQNTAEHVLRPEEIETARAIDDATVAIEETIFEGRNDYDVVGFKELLDTLDQEHNKLLELEKRRQSLHKEMQRLRKDIEEEKQAFAIDFPHLGEVFVAEALQRGDVENLNVEPSSSAASLELVDSERSVGKNAEMSDDDMANAQQKEPKN